MQNLVFFEKTNTRDKKKCDYFRTVSGNYLFLEYFIGQKISGWTECLLTRHLCVDMPNNIPNDMIWSENTYVSLWVRFGLIVNVCNVNLFILKIVFGSFSKFMNLFFFIGFNKYLCVWFFLGPFLFSRKWICCPDLSSVMLFCSFFFFCESYLFMQLGFFPSQVSGSFAYFKCHLIMCSFS